MKEVTQTPAVEASQWFKNGDHPDDYDREKIGYENGELRTWTADEVKALGWEGQVVRYFRSPVVSGKSLCEHCRKPMNEHGWIDSGGSGKIVCPGDFIITSAGGDFYVCRHDFFTAVFKPAPA